eukprot:TRINITY_DN24251_c0_g1_i1.p1 TRINITY_DN24251_c0_g1~~TRINITY_DN24251_c0_g1_i1.p1  ORF type:complete len:272 (+),score=80.44 TRINITY_DN24251_c0_g1_i1:120-935(+)
MVKGGQHQKAKTKGAGGNAKRKKSTGAGLDRVAAGKQLNNALMRWSALGTKATIPQLRKYMECGAQLSVTDLEGNTTMQHIVCLPRKNMISVLNAFLAIRGCEEPNRRHVCALMAEERTITSAVSRGSEANVLYLLDTFGDELRQIKELGPVVDMASKRGFRGEVLSRLMELGECDPFELLSKAGRVPSGVPLDLALLTTTDEYERSGVHFLAIHGMREELQRALVLWPGAVHEEDNKSRTPLHSAAIWGHVRCALLHWWERRERGPVLFT